MNFQIIEEKISDDGTKLIVLKMPKNRHLFVGYILEALEGACHFSVAPGNKNFFCITIPKDFIEEIEEMLTILQNYQEEEL